MKRRFLRSYVLNRVVMRACWKPLLPKALVEKLGFRIMRSEGWTLVNFEMVNAKACMNKTVLNRLFMKRGFLRSCVLNRVPMRTCCFTSVLLKDVAHEGSC